MPIYKVEVVEVRHVECSYWVEVDDHGSLREARRKADIGDTVHEEEHCYSVNDRAVKEEPTLDDMTPIEHLTEQARDLKEGDLDDAVNNILSTRAKVINNGGKDFQLEFLLKEVGEEEAIRIVNGLLRDCGLLRD